MAVMAAQVALAPLEARAVRVQVCVLTKSGVVVMAVMADVEAMVAVVVAVQVDSLSVLPIAVTAALHLMPTRLLSANKVQGVRPMALMV